MGVAFAAERRLLAEEEHGHVVRSHYPALEEVPRDELIELARRLRSHRDRAKDIVRHRRRVRRGKADPRNAAAETSSERGLSAKKQVFARALKRVNARLKYLHDQEKQARIRANLSAALVRKRGAAVQRHRGSRTPGSGMRPIENRKGIRILDPSMIGRVSQSGRVAQARRDDRDR